MEIIRTNNTSRLSLKYIVGYDDEKQKDITKSVSYTQLAEGATDANVHALATELAALCSYEFLSATRIDTAALSIEG